VDGGCSDVVMRFVWCLLRASRTMVEGVSDVSLHAIFHVCAAWALYLTTTLSLHFRVPGSVCVPAHAWTRLTLHTVFVPVGTEPELTRLPPPV
jgi:hypothetical protein